MHTIALRHAITHFNQEYSKWVEVCEDPKYSMTGVWLVLCWFITPSRVSWRRVETMWQVSKATMASAKEIKHQTESWISLHTSVTGSANMFASLLLLTWWLPHQLAPSSPVYIACPWVCYPWSPWSQCPPCPVQMYRPMIPLIRQKWHFWPICHYNFWIQSTYRGWVGHILPLEIMFSLSIATW